MTTGRVPFEGHTPVEIATQHIQAPLPPPRQLNPALPAAVEQVIARAVAKRPADRFATAGDMSRALCAAVTGSQPAAPSCPPARARFPIWPLAGLLAGLAIVMLVGLTASGAIARLAVTLADRPLVAAPAARGRHLAFADGDIVPGSLILRTGDFDNPALSGWRASGPIQIGRSQGRLVLTGQPPGDGALYLDAQLASGQAALFLLQFQSDTQFQLALASGAARTPSELLFGMQHAGATGFASSAPGLGQPIQDGNLSAAPGQWYWVLLQAGDPLEFVARVWARDDTRHFVEWRQAAPAGWAEQPWNVCLQVGAGQLLVERYELLAPDGGE